jgi:hypothetical protein
LIRSLVQFILHYRDKNGNDNNKGKFGKIGLPENFPLVYDKITIEKTKTVGHTAGHLLSNEMIFFTNTACIANEDEIEKLISRYNGRKCLTKNKSV